MLTIKSDAKSSRNAEEPCDVAIGHCPCKKGPWRRKGRERASADVVRTGRLKYDASVGAFRNVFPFSLHCQSGTNFVPPEQRGVVDLVRRETGRPQKKGDRANPIARQHNEGDDVCVSNVRHVVSPRKKGETCTVSARLKCETSYVPGGRMWRAREVGRNGRACHSFSMFSGEHYYNNSCL